MTPEETLQFFSPLMGQQEKNEEVEPSTSQSSVNDAQRLLNQLLANAQTPVPSQSSPTLSLNALTMNLILELVKGFQPIEPVSSIPLQSPVTPTLSTPPSNDALKTLMSSLSVSSTSSTDSGLGTSDRSTRDSPPSQSQTPLTRGKKKDEYCKVCRDVIFKAGTRSQGPRRHILQRHLKARVYECPFQGCDYFSGYDKAHVNNHFARTHKGFNNPGTIDNHERYEKKVNRWQEICFGRNSDGMVPKELKEKKEEEIEEKEQEEETSETK